MERSDWKKHIQLKDKNNYSNSQAAQTATENLAKFINPEMLSPSIISEEKVEVVRKHQFTFNNSDNMK